MLTYVMLIYVYKPYIILYFLNLQFIFFQKKTCDLRGNIRMTEEERKAAENFQNMLKVLVEAEESAEKMEDGTGDVDVASMREFRNRLKVSFFRLYCFILQYLFADCELRKKHQQYFVEFGRRRSF